ncbi:hypothetical protein AB0K35_27755 [Micromonospora sp. NPDC053740]|uniref:hypothetical protein n=1 Tax=Micromonospora sp. NPDC053740 TaxID=3155173 RepID=UPI00342B0CE4
MAGDRPNLTGPQHVELALQLADLAEQPTWEDGKPSDAQRDRMLMRAHLHANLARTAAMVDGQRWNDGSVSQNDDVRRAWHDVFSVKR